MSGYSFLRRENRHHSRLWQCVCDCGETVVVNYGSLANGDTRSCGCLFKETRKGGLNKKLEGESAFNQLYYNYRKSARERGYPFELDEEIFRSLTKQPCYYCGRPPSQIAHVARGTHGNYIYTGIDRIDSTQGYIASNVRPCCKMCNTAKGSLTEQEFYEWVLRVLTHRSQREMGE